MRKLIVAAVVMACVSAGCKSRCAVDAVAASSDSLAVAVKESEVVKEENFFDVVQSEHASEARIDFTEGDGLIRLYPDGSVALRHVAAIEGRNVANDKVGKSIRQFSDSTTLSLQSSEVSDAVTVANIPSSSNGVNRFARRLVVLLAAVAIIAMIAVYRKNH